MIDDLQSLLEKSENLLNKLEEISKHPSFHGVFTMAHIHNYKYDGPSWNKEFDELQDIINKIKKNN